MLSFQNVIELMKEEKTLLEFEDSRSEEKCIAAIRTGLNIQPQFWDDFLRLLNNSDSLAILLDLPKERMSRWHSRIDKYLEITQKMDSDEHAMNKKARLMATGYH